MLENAVQNVKDATARVLEAEAAIEPLRQDIRHAEQELTQKVGKAIAFLKVYVEGDEAEYAKLDALTQALIARRPQRRSSESAAVPGAERGRGRGRKRSAGEAAVDGFDVAQANGEIADLDLPSSALSQLEPAAE